MRLGEPSRAQREHGVEGFDGFFVAVRAEEAKREGRARVVVLRVARDGELVLLDRVVDAVERLVGAPRL